MLRTVSAPVLQAFSALCVEGESSSAVERATVSAQQQRASASALAGGLALGT